MNSQEAKFILEAYRHHGGDATDPQFREALEQARLDPDLAKWLSEGTALNAALSAKLKSVPVPPDLKAKILAGRKIVDASPLWRRRTALAVAAVVIILASLTPLLFTPRPGNNFALFRNDMTEFLSTKLDRLDMETTDMSKIREWLGEHGAHSDAVVPGKVAELRNLGCRIIDWKGEKVTLLCFKLNGPQEVHLLVADQSKFRNPPSNKPEFQKSGSWMTAAWSKDGKVYVLAGLGDRAALQKYF